MNLLSKVWHFISYLGIEEKKNLDDRSIVLSNQLNTTLFIILLLMSVALHVLRVVNDTSITIASYRILWMMGINIIHFTLSYYKQHNLAKALLIFLTPFVLILVPTFIGFVEEDSFFNYTDIIIALSLIPQLLIKPSRRAWLYITSLVYYFVLLLIIDNLILHFSPNTLNAPAVYKGFQVYAEITAIAIFVFINAAVYYLKWINFLYEKRLHEKQEQLLSNNNKLDKHVEELKAINNHLKTTQEQLIQSEKMASLGILTAGVAHEINTPLNFISTGTLMVKNAIDDIDNGRDSQLIKTDLQEADQILEKGVDQAAFIVSSLMTFSYSGKSTKVDHDIHSIIESTLMFLKTKMPDDLKIIKAFKIDIPISIYAEKIHQVALNIIDNAISASVNASDKLIKIDCYISENGKGKYACISIFNKGANIDKEIGKHIFDPFFTTKSINNGTGLGLSTAYNIVEEHNGYLSYKNHDDGVEFLVELPINLQ